MDINSIGKLISESRMGTRIPEDMLGLPSREERYNRTYSMDPVQGVSNVRRNVQGVDSSTATQGASTQNDKLTSMADAVSSKANTGSSATDAAQAIASLIDNNTGTADVNAFYDVLQKAIAEQQTRTISRELTSDPEYYKNLMTLSRFSSGLISDNLNSLGTSGASIFNLE